MFEDQGEDCVFMEMSRNIRHHPHMVLECIPLPKEVGDLSPIYFKVSEKTHLKCFVIIFQLMK